MAELRGVAAGVSDRERDGRPSGHTGEADDRRRELGGGEDLGGRSGSYRSRCGTELDDDVGEMHDALEAVLSDEDRRALVVDEAGEGSQHLLGRDRVERGRRLVEHERPGRGGKGGADGDALALAARQCRDGPLAQRVQVQGVEHVFDPTTHRRRVDAEVLHGIGELVFDCVRDEARVGVLAHVADDIGEVPGTVLLGVRPSTVTVPFRRPPEKWGTRPFTQRRRVDLPAPVAR